MERILIVEDEKLIRRGLKVMIEDSGIPFSMILESANGEEAIHVLEDTVVDLVITDVRMPKKSGIELARYIIQMPSKPLLIVISGYDDFMYAVEALRCGAIDYLLKPVECGEFYGVLERAEEIWENSQSLKKNMLASAVKTILEAHDRTKEHRRAVEQARITYEKIQGDISYLVAAFVPQNIMLYHDSEEQQELFRQGLYIGDIADSGIWLITEEAMKSIGGEEKIGISKVHRQASGLEAAFKEATTDRWEKYFASLQTGCLAQDWKFCLNGHLEARQHSLLLKKEELQDVLRCMLIESAAGRLACEEFEHFMLSLLQTAGNMCGKEMKDINVLHLLWFGNCEEWLDYVLEYLTGSIQVLPESSVVTRQKMLIAMEYIQKNYFKELNLAIVSNYVSMNYTRFSSQFKKITGTSFVNYLKKVRIEKSKELLMGTDMNIAQISETVGMDCVKTFFHVFHDVTGMSPGEYRKREWNEKSTGKKIQDSIERGSYEDLWK